MATRAACILLPPSKGKTDDSQASTLTYRASLRHDHPLNPAREAVLDALLDQHAKLNQQTQARLYGVDRANLKPAHTRTGGLATAETKPARERYRGVVYNNAGLSNETNDHRHVDVLIVSALLGVAELDSPVPNYRLEWNAALPHFGSFARFWQHAAREYLAERLDGRFVWNLLPNEFRTVLRDIPITKNWCDVTFATPSGGRANTARTKVAKGRIVAALRALGPISPAELAKRNPLAPQWQLIATKSELTAVCTVP